MKIAFYGGQTAGFISLLTLIAKRQDVKIVFAEDEKVKNLAELFSIPVADKNNINMSKTIDTLKKSIDLLVCCHARKILKKELVDTIPSINLHPCLYKYKGGYPIQRLIQEKNPKASVACHWMIEQVDAGKTIVEEYMMIQNVETKTEAEIYNELYPLYTSVLLKSLSIIKSKKI